MSSSGRQSADMSIVIVPLIPDAGSNNSGYYRLQAVLTHRGRSSSSGHYVAWVARGDGWLRCDDDAVSPVTEDEVLKLSGGGEYCLYNAYP